MPVAAEGNSAEGIDPRIDVVSFDVFDTFLLRRCTTPDGVYELTCQLAGCDVSRSGLVASFIQHRQIAEAAARKASVSRRRHGEVTIEEIYAEFPRRLFGLTALDAGALGEAEFQAELALCLPDPDIAAFYEQARALGKRTGFVSDTYWTAARLGRLLRRAAPGLAWDFLYASCDHGASKSGTLFKTVLATEKLAGDRVLHVGDNPVADIATPRRLGLRAHHHSQASIYLAGLFQREATACTLFAAAAPTGTLLDDGLRTLRRIIARTQTVDSDAFALGSMVLGPVMTAFCRFVAAEVATIAAVPGRRVAIAFLARDGLLPFRLWSAQAGTAAAGYVEINRRAVAIAAADAEGGFKALFRAFDAIDHAATVEILGVDTPALRRFFAKAPKGLASSDALAAALPRLLGHDQVTRLAKPMRAGLIDHLRRSVPGYDGCTDLVLVDLGYSGSVQKGLRRVLRLAGVNIRLHGLYVLTKDENLDDLGDDTATGFLNDLVMSPQAKLLLLSNIAVLEQLCTAPHGSVRGYRDGHPVREVDPRPTAQLDLAGRAQDGALHFAARQQALAAAGFDPFADPTRRSTWATAMLARLLLLPTDDELLLLGSVRHDVNLGSKAVVALADPATAAGLSIAKSFPEVCRMATPPMWPAGSITALSPAQGFLYALNGTGQMSAEIFGDIACGDVEVTLVDRQAAHATRVTCLRTGTGDLRIRVPYSAAQHLQAVAIAIGQIAPRGLVRGVALQTGRDTPTLMAAVDIERLGADRLQCVGLTVDGPHFVAEPDGKLIILLPPLADGLGMLSLVLTPLTDNRVMALASDTADAPAVALPTLR